MWARILATTMVALLPAQSTAHSQQRGQDSGSEPHSGPTFAARSELVVLHVTVKSGKDAYVTGLPREAFSVVEDGRPQTVSFLADADTPVTVGLLIDSSGSMHANRELVIAAATAFAESGHADDEVFALAFNDDVRPALPVQMPFTSDPGVLRGALGRAIGAYGRTALYDAVWEGLDYVERGSRERRVLVVVSDGGDNASATPLERVLEKAQASNAVVYTIALIDPLSRAANRRPLRAIAAASGGESFEPKRARQVGDVLRRIAGDIRQTYAIGYVPTTPLREGGFRHVRVTVSDPAGRRLSVRSRGGYLAAPAR